MSPEDHSKRASTRLQAFWLRLLAVMVMVWIACPVALADDAKRVLILHSFGREFKPWSEYGRTIRTELERQSRWQIEFFDHSLAATRVADGGAEQSFVVYLQALFASRPPDLIISIGAPAAAFVQRNRARFFADTPMVLTAIDQRRVHFSNLAENDTAVSVHIDVLAAFMNILRVLPDTENVMVVVGTSPIERFWKGAIAKDVEPLAGRLKLSWTDELSFDALLKRASTLPPRSAIFWELMIIDATGVVHEGNSAMAKVHAVANAPLFSYDESFFGDGMVGGPFLHVIDTARQTAAVAVRILGGEKAGDIRVQFGPPTFDWRELQRWSIPEARLPPDSVIRFRQPTAWDQYRWQIIAIGLAALLQAGIIYWLLYERQRRRMSEAMTRNTLSELARMNRLATGSELSASIAHEVMQPLTGMVSSANAGLRWLSAPSPDINKVRDMLGQVVAAGHRAAQVVRAIRAALKREPNVRQAVEVNELVVTVLALTRHELDQHSVEAQTHLESGLPEITADPVQLQQLLLNLILNAVESMRLLESGRSRMLVLRTGKAEGGIEMGVQDTGPGVATDRLDQIFKPLFTTKSEGLGLGLAICRAIVEAHHGRIWATAVQPNGLSVIVYLPLAAPEA